jgi:succinate dehydrogenase / fumarate reductase, cytochrome b subunit
MRTVNRPLSPHLQIYRPQITSVLSILHRGTGVLLALGLLGLVAWFVALAAGAEAYETLQNFFSSVVGRLLLLGFSFSLFYHMSNGVRHLFWDCGYGFDVKTAERSGIAVVVMAVLLTGGAWLAACLLSGGGQ